MATLEEQFVFFNPNPVRVEFSLYSQQLKQANKQSMLVIQLMK